MTLENVALAMMNDGDCNPIYNKALVKFIEKLIFNTLEKEGKEFDYDYTFDLCNDYLQKLLKS